MADPQIRQQVMDVLANPMDLPSTFWDYATQNWLKDAPVFPISQVFGFTQFVAQMQVTLTTESVVSLTYTDLATVGPTLSALPDGKYVVLFGALASTNAAADAAVMSPSFNGAAAADTESDASGSGADAATRSTVITSVVGAWFRTLSNGGSNTITLKYKSSSAVSTATFANRWVLALKYANV